MFSIGEFSRLAQLSIRVLRHYDEIGLLVPAYTNGTNGYRYLARSSSPTSTASSRSRTSDSASNRCAG
jgi:hypothetical protein